MSGFLGVDRVPVALFYERRCARVHEAVACKEETEALTLLACSSLLPLPDRRPQHEKATNRSTILPRRGASGSGSHPEGWEEDQ